MKLFKCWSGVKLTMSHAADVEGGIKIEFSTEHGNCEEIPDGQELTVQEERNWYNICFEPPGLIF